jgi:hypothetical protein
MMVWLQGKSYCSTIYFGFKLSFGSREEGFRVIQRKEVGLEIDNKGKEKEVVDSAPEDIMGLGSPIALSKTLEEELEEEEAESLRKEVSTLVVPGIVTESDLTSADATHLLASFLRLSKKERANLLGKTQKELAASLAGLDDKKRKGLKFMKSPKHKRSRRRDSFSD